MLFVAGWHLWNPPSGVSCCRGTWGGVWRSGGAALPADGMQETAWPSARSKGHRLFILKNIKLSGGEKPPNNPKPCIHSWAYLTLKPKSLTSTQSKSRIGMLLAGLWAAIKLLATTRSHAERLSAAFESIRTRWAAAVGLP